MSYAQRYPPRGGEGVQLARGHISATRPDDPMSFVRLLLYSNELDLGL
jgi:hypothetical protein